MAQKEITFSDRSKNGAADQTITDLDGLPSGIPANATLDSVVLSFTCNRTGGRDDNEIRVQLGDTIYYYIQDLGKNDPRTCDITGIVRNNSGTLTYLNGGTSLKLYGYHAFKLFDNANWSLTNIKITANYTIPTYTLTVTAGAGGTVTGGGTYENGSTATLTATPNTGYKFIKWSDGNTSATRTVTVTGNATYTATFEPITYYIAFDSNGGSSIYDDRVIDYSYDNSLILGSYGFVAPEVKITYEHNGGTCNIASIKSDRPLIGWEDLGSIKAPNGTVYTAEMFDAPYYANTQADLLAAFGYDKYALLSHYQNNGKAEGRPCVNTNGSRGVYPEGASITHLTNIDGETVTLRCQWGSVSNTLPNITKTGCEFLGWSDGTNTYQIGDVIESTENKTFVAQWKPKDSRIVISDTTQIDCLGVYVQPSSQSIIFKTENTGYWRDGEGADSVDGWHIKVRYSSDPIFSEPGVYEVSEIYINGERRW